MARHLVDFLYAYTIPDMRIEPPHAEQLVDSRYTEESRWAGQDGMQQMIGYAITGTTVTRSTAVGSGDKRRTIEELERFGAFSLSDTGVMSMPFVVLSRLNHKLGSNFVIEPSLLRPSSVQSPWAWKDWEKLLPEFHRARVKSLIDCKQQGMTLSTLFRGARFGTAALAARDVLLVAGPNRVIEEDSVFAGNKFDAVPVQYSVDLFSGMRIPFKPGPVFHCAANTSLFDCRFVLQTSPKPLAVFCQVRHREEDGSPKTIDIDISQLGQWVADCRRVLKHWLEPDSLFDVALLWFTNRRVVDRYNAHEKSYKDLIIIDRDGLPEYLTEALCFRGLVEKTESPILVAQRNFLSGGIDLVTALNVCISELRASANNPTKDVSHSAAQTISLIRSAALDEKSLVAVSCLLDLLDLLVWRNWLPQYQSSPSPDVDVFVDATLGLFVDATLGKVASELKVVHQAIRGIRAMGNFSSDGAQYQKLGEHIEAVHQVHMRAGKGEQFKAFFAELLLTQKNRPRCVEILMEWNSSHASK